MAGLNLGELFFQLGARTEGLRRAEREAGRFANRTERHFNRASGGARRLGIAIASIITIDAARRTVLLADSYNILQQRLITATKATQDYARVSEQIFRISNSNGTALATNVSLFQSLARAAPELGATTSEILALTEAVGQLGVIGGSSAAAQQNGLLQFTQGLSAGILRAEEMNSILENLPELANRIAQGMDLTVGGLRRAVLAGEVLSTDVFQSLLGQTEEIAREFADLPPTVSRSFISLQNSFSRFLGELDSTVGVTGEIAETFLSWSSALDDGAAQRFSYAIEDITDDLVVWRDIDLSGITGGISELTESFGLAGDGLTDVYEQFLILPANVRAFAVQSSANFEIFTNDVAEFSRSMAVTLELQWARLGDIFYQFIDRFRLNFSRSIDQVLIYFAGRIDDIAAAIEGIPLLSDRLNLNGLSESLRAAADNEQNLSSQIEAGTEARQQRIISIQRELAALKLYYAQASSESAQRIIEANAELEAITNLIEQQREARARERAEAEAAANIQAPIVEAQRPVPVEVADPTETRRQTTKLKALQDSLSTELELEQRHYAQSLETLKTAEDLQIETAISYDALRERLAEQHQQRLTEIHAKGSDERKRQEALGAFLGVDLVRTASDLTLQEQAQGFRAQINQAAGHSREFFALQKALALATAFVEAPKAILSAYTFGTALGGPALGNAFGGIAAAATATQIAAISSQQYRSAKAVGGEVFSGGAYRVNENGPELFTTGGQEFLLTGNSSGKITPSNEIGAGAGNVTVNVYPIEGETATVTETQTEDGTVIDVMIERVESRLVEGVRRGSSDLSTALENQYGLNRAAGI